MDPVKQTKYDQMLSQLDSDVITPAKKSPSLNIQPKQESLVPVTTAPEILKPEITERVKPIIQLPEEPEDDDDDDIEKIKSNILKTLSKIEQAEVD